ncbi:hypothetical protein [Andreprevotia lacus]|jgi:hypothetical protein|nr:hypothetical protein [Andreprevotia lacus]
MSTESVSTQLVDQRVRNRIIEYLAMLATHESDPLAWDLAETINQWEDWVHSPAGEDQFLCPTYSPDECAHLVAVDKAWSAFADATPVLLGDDAAEMQRPEWRVLVLAACAALEVMMQRGRLPEDHQAHGSVGA